MDQASMDKTTSFGTFSTPWFIAIAFALCVGVPVYAAQGSTGGWTTLAPAPAVVLLVLFGLRYAWVAASGQIRLFEMCAWLFTYVFMALAPYVQRRDNAVLDTTPSVNFALTHTAYWIVGLGALAMAVGSFLGGQAHRQAVAGNAVATRSRAMNHGANVHVLRLRMLMVGSWLGVAYMLAKTGGVGVLFKSRFAVSDANSAAFQEGFQAVIVSAFADMTLLVSAVGLILHVRRDDHTSTDSGLAWIQGLMAVVVINPLSSPRYVFGTAFLALMGALGLFESLRRFRITTVAAVAAFLVAFPILDSFRVSTTGGLKSVDPLGSLLSGDFDSFNEVINAADYVHQVGTTHGRQLLGVFLFAVPRMIWPNKPLDTGILMAHFKGYKFTNLSAPLWSETYMNGGWLFLIIGMLTVGFALRMFDDHLDARIVSGSGASITGLILPFYLLILMRGSLLQAGANLSMILLSVLWIHRRKNDLLQEIPALTLDA